MSWSYALGNRRTESQQQGYGSPEGVFDGEFNELFFDLSTPAIYRKNSPRGTATGWVAVTAGGGNNTQTVSAGTGVVEVTATSGGTTLLIVDVGNGSGTRTIELLSAAENSIVQVFATFTAGSTRTLTILNGDGGPSIFSEVSQTDAGYADLRFVSDGVDWIAGGPNLAFFETVAVATEEVATDLSAFTAAARRYSAASFNATADDAAISSWSDLSGNAAHATQATGGNRPVKKTVGSFNAVLFDGTDDYLDCTTATSAGDDFTVIAVIDAVGTANGCLIGDNSDPSQGLRVGDYGGVTRGVSLIAENGTGAAQSGNMTLTNLCVVSVKVTNGVAAFKLNGNVVANNATTGTINLISFGRIGDEAGNAAPYSGYLYDLYAADSAIADDDDIIDAYKAHYNIA